MMRRLLGSRLLLMPLALGSMTLGAVLADVIVDDGMYVVPEPEVAHVIPSPEGAEPTGLIGDVAVAPVTPLFPDAVVVHPTEFDEEGIPHPDYPAEGPGQPGVSQGAPADGATPDGGGSGVQEPMPVSIGDVAVARFLDLCTLGGAGCPVGVPATVLYAASQDPPPPIEFSVLPEATRALLPSLRCDPGMPSRTAIPLVLLGNRPFDLLHVTLRAQDGTLLDEIVNTSSDPSEFTLFDQRFGDGKPIAPTVAEGAHTCLTLETDGRVGEAPDRTGGFEVFVQGYADRSYQAHTVPFTGQYDAVRPPVKILPLDANRAYLVVPQLPDDTTVAWVTRHSGFSPGCQGTPPQLDPRATRRTPLASPQAFSASDLAAPDYPWDRSYSHYTIWDLDLAVASDYVLCVRWIGEATAEEWYLETPNGYELYVGAGPLRHTRTRTAGTLLVHLLGVPGCFVANPHGQSDNWPPFPDQTVYGDGVFNPYPDMCHSNGQRLGTSIELRALFPDGTNTVYGVVKVPTSVLIDKCRSGGQAAPCTQRLEWRNRNILCGGGFGDPTCQGDLWFALDVYFVISERSANNRPHPRDWGIFKIARLATEEIDPLPPTVPLP